MTATPAEDQRAGQAQAQGEAADGRHQADAQQQHQASGSAVVVEQVSTPDDIAVAWIPAGDSTAQPTLVPSTPPAVNNLERNPSDPT